MKLKTHKGASKRIKKTSTGKLIYQKPNKRHLLINKSKRQKKLNSSGAALHSTDQAKIRRLLP